LEWTHKTNRGVCVCGGGVYVCVRVIQKNNFVNFSTGPSLILYIYMKK